MSIDSLRTKEKYQPLYLNYRDAMDHIFTFVGEANDDAVKER